MCCFNNCKSGITKANIGVLQGSLFRLLLFSTFINDLITVSNKLESIMYTDVITI